MPLNFALCFNVLGNPVCSFYFVFCLSNTTVLTTGSSVLLQCRNVSNFFLAIKMSIRGDSSEGCFEQIIG